MAFHLRNAAQSLLLIPLVALVLNYFQILPSFSLLTQLYTSHQATIPAVAFNNVSNTTYYGFTNPLTSVSHFHSIPYAQPPTGSSRFRPPILLPPDRDSILEATNTGALCPQARGPAAFPFTSPVTNTSEDCLTLRIAAPAGLSKDQKLPVVVYLHGGGNILGGGTDQLYTPDGLVQESVKNGQPIIYVAVNYRLGIFGYAMNKALRDAKSANAGLRDQRVALEWVREYIGAFGGDGRRVTVVGQSVGASSLGLHLTSYGGGQGVPFDQAMMMSGASGTNFNIMSDYVANNTVYVAKKVGCTGDFDSEETVRCLQQVPMQTLEEESIALARSLRPPFGELSFYPAWDGDYIQDRPSELLKKGKFVKGVPLIASWVTNDGAWYPPPTVNTSSEVSASFATFVPGLTAIGQERILSAYPVSSFQHLVRPDGFPTAQYYRAAQINRDLWFTCPVIDFTWQYARMQGGQGLSSVRLYEFNQTRFGPVYEAMGVPFWRVAHLSDIPYVLGNENVAGNADNGAEQIALGRRMSGNVAAFAHTGDPEAPLDTESGDDVLERWLPAYEGSMVGNELEEIHPSRMNVKVIGGKHGTGLAMMKRDQTDKSRALTEMERAIEWEDLFRRCDVISSLSEEIGV